MTFSPLGRCRPTRPTPSVGHAAAGGHSQVSRLLGILALGAFAWVASGLRTFTWPAGLATGTAGAGVLLAAAADPRPRLPWHVWWAGLRRQLSTLRHPRRAPRPIRHAATWLLLLTLALLLELSAFVAPDRHAHPTLSSLADEVLTTHAARFTAYLFWLWGGVALVRR